MRMLQYRVPFAITFLFVQGNAESTSASGLVTNDFALNLTTQPDREKGTSVSPRNSTPHNIAVEKTERGSGGFEERAWPLLPWVSEVVNKLRDGVFSKLNQHPKDVLDSYGFRPEPFRPTDVNIRPVSTDVHIEVDGFLGWLKHVDWYRFWGNELSDSELIDVLLGKSIPEIELVVLFDYLRYSQQIGDRVNVFIRALAEKCSPEAFDKMASLWSNFKLHPRKVFRILGIGSEDFSETSSLVFRWLRYAEAFRIMHGSRVYSVKDTAKIQFPKLSSFPQARAFLEKARQEQDLVQLVNQLEYILNKWVDKVTSLKDASRMITAAAA